MKMIEIDNIEFLLRAAKKMEEISGKYCVKTECTDDRMKSFSGDRDCYWYHSSWLYSRLTGVVTSYDYFGDKYRQFFAVNNDKRINVLICGLADYVIIGHVLRRIPKDIADSIELFVIDICESPLKLSEWYLSVYEPFSAFLKSVHFVKADATQLPFEDDSFDMITTYSFLSRMSNELSCKVVSEWKRVLRRDGVVLTSFHQGYSSRSEYNAYDLSSHSNEDSFGTNSHESNRLIDASQIQLIKFKAAEFSRKITVFPISIDAIKELFSGFKLVLEHKQDKNERTVILIHATNIKAEKGDKDGQN